MPRHYTPAERAIIYACTISKLPLDQVNSVLGSVSTRKLPDSSYQMLVGKYAKYFAEDLTRIGAALFKPVSLSQIASLGTAENIADMESALEGEPSLATPLDGDRFLEVLRDVLPTAWDEAELGGGAKGWTKFMTSRIAEVANSAGLGICSHYLNEATRDWKDESDSRQLRREYGYDFTLFQNWTEYEQPAVVIEHENAWNVSAFLADFWKLMFAFAPLRVMFGYSATRSGLDAYVNRIRQLAAQNRWSYPAGTEDLVLLGYYDMAPREFRVLRRHANSTDWVDAGALADI